MEDVTTGGAEGASVGMFVDEAEVGPVTDALLVWLARIDGAGVSDRARIDDLAALERVCAAVEAAKARVTSAYAESQRSSGASRRSIAAEVGLARRIGLSRAERVVAAARTLVADLPHTLAALADGRTSVARAEAVAERLGDLAPEQRRAVDRQLAPDLPALGDREVRDAVDAVAARLDPGHVETRHRLAFAGQRVTVRPLGDGMALLSALMTAADAASCHATLVAHARSVLAGDGGRHTGLVEQGEGRTEGQVMADALVARLTGRAVDEQPPVEIQLVVSDSTLLGQGAEAAHVLGVGPVPASVARALVGAGALDLVHGTGWATRSRTQTRQGSASTPEDARDLARRLGREERRVTVRRVHTARDGRRPVAIDARRRILPPSLRAQIADGDRQSVATSGSARAPSLMPPSARAPAPEMSSPRADAFAELAAWVRTPPRPPDLAPLVADGRLFTGALRRFVLLRDPTCRAPWCTAPARHVDHVRPWVRGGPTSAANASGCCVGHNQVKEQPGWSVSVSHDGLLAEDQPHTTSWRSPTGRTWESVAPPLLHRRGSSGVATVADHSPLERHLEDLLAA